METQEFKEKISKIGVILGMSVEFPSNDDMRWHRWAYLKNGDRSIRISNGEENKLNISGAFPQTIKGEMGRYGNPIDINVTCSKTPDQIARDIERRLIPLYLPELEKAVDQVNATNLWHQKREANIKKLAEYFGIEFEPDKNPSIYVYDQIKGLGSRIEASGEDTVKFEVNVTPNMAIELFNFLKQKSL